MRALHGVDGASRRMGARHMLMAGKLTVTLAMGALPLQGGMVHAT